jgi:hypothetical protein
MGLNADYDLMAWKQPKTIQANAICRRSGVREHCDWFCEKYRKSERTTGQRSWTIMMYVPGTKSKKAAIHSFTKLALG